MDAYSNANANRIILLQYNSLVMSHWVNKKNVPCLPSKVGDADSMMVATIMTNSSFLSIQHALIQQLLMQCRSSCSLHNWCSDHWWPITLWMPQGVDLSCFSAKGNWVDPIIYVALFSFQTSNLLRKDYVIRESILVEKLHCYKFAFYHELCLG